MEQILKQFKTALVRRIEDRLHTAQFSVPAAEVLLPWVVGGVAGLLAASALGWAVGYHLMPPARRPAASRELPSEQPQVRIPSNPQAAEFNWIGQRNLFDSSGVGMSSQSSGAECVPQKSGLPLKVKGIIFGGSSVTSLALLESSATQLVDSFVLGESVPGNGRVSAITQDRVYFLQGPCPEYLEVEQPQDIKRRVADPSKRTKQVTPSAGSGEADYSEDGFERRGDQIAVDKQWIEKAVGVDFAKTLQDAKATPNVVAGGQVKGFVMTQIRPDSVYEKMGMINGDVVRSINGIELNDAARAIQTLQAMRTETQLEVVIEREGKQVVRKIQVK